MVELRGDKLLVLVLALGSIGTEVGRQRFGHAHQGSRIMATTVSDCYAAPQSVVHDDLNVLCLGARVIGPELARTFADAQFSGGERHVHRLTEVAEIEHAGVDAPDRARGKAAT
ncbi:MAG: RpiB/LacA/LacB family sugar-phosphate isomerase [Actinomycetota bacterium]|nr:RpiB/LacA/LacB family sugar-phosphate isomerase [Actinomycetota bacterium]